MKRHAGQTFTRLRRLKKLESENERRERQKRQTQPDQDAAQVDEHGEQLPADPTGHLDRDWI